MFVSNTLGFSLAVVAFSTLVTGDPASILTIKSATVTNHPNDYWGEWSVEISKGKASSLVSAKIPAKADVPDSMAVKFFIKAGDQDPIEYTSSLCDGLQEDLVGKSFGNAGMPKDTFPKECPFIAGDWSILKWDPPVENIPPALPDGPVTGYMQILEEGKEPYVQIDFEAELSHGLPLGR